MRFIYVPVRMPLLCRSICSYPASAEVQDLDACMINRSPVHFTINDVLLCSCTIDACVPTGLESTYCLVSSMVSYGTMTLSLQSLSFSSWNAHACLGPQKNFVFFLVRMRRSSVALGYNAWPTFPPRNLALNCIVCRKLAILCVNIAKPFYLVLPKCAFVLPQGQPLFLENSKNLFQVCVMIFSFAMH